jgi:hypothetical protein
MKSAPAAMAAHAGASLIVITANTVVCRHAQTDQGLAHPANPPRNKAVLAPIP